MKMMRVQFILFGFILSGSDQAMSFSTALAILKPSPGAPKGSWSAALSR